MNKSPNSLLPLTSVALLLLGAQNLRAAAFIGTTYEPFDYPDSTVISASLNLGTGWNATGDSTIANTTAWGSNTTGGTTVDRRGVFNVSLTATASGYPTGLGGHATINGSGIGRTLGQTVDTGTFYFSLLIDRNTTDENRTLNIAFFNGTTEQFAVGQIGSATQNPGSAGNLALFLNNATLVSAASPIALGNNVSHLVIGRVDWNIDGTVTNDRIRLYIDPVSVADESLLTPYIDTVGNFTAVTQFRLFAGTAASPFGQVSGDFDELRFSSSFSGATIPEPASLSALLGGIALLVNRRRQVKSC